MRKITTLAAAAVIMGGTLATSDAKAGYWYGYRGGGWGGGAVLAAGIFGLAAGAALASAAAYPAYGYPVYGYPAYAGYPVYAAPVYYGGYGYPIYRRRVIYPYGYYGRPIYRPYYGYYGRPYYGYYRGPIYRPYWGGRRVYYRRRRVGAGVVITSSSWPSVDRGCEVILGHVSGDEVLRPSVVGRRASSVTANGA